MYKVGVDLGGTNISSGVVNDKMEIIGRGKLKTRCPRDYKAILDDVVKTVKIAVNDADITMDEVESIGLGTPGSVNKAPGYIEYANNLGFNRVPAGEYLKERLHKKIYIDNDANCAALGEAKAGVGRGVSSFVAITLGTGVGSGIVLNGELWTGVNDCAGEMGHMVIVPDGESCSCGRRGCWAQYSSATALIRLTKDSMRHNMDSVMWDMVDNNISKVGGRTAFDAMRAGDAAASRVVDRYIYYLSLGITNVVNALQPEIICIGGGVGHEGENLLVPLRKYVERQRYDNHAQKQTQIVSAKLGNDAGIIGAALLDR